VRGADDLTPSCAECHESLGAQTSWNPVGDIGPVTGLLYLYCSKDEVYRVPVGIAGLDWGCGCLHCLYSRVQVLLAETLKRE